MFRKILYPTDFSPYANAVVHSLLDLKPAGIKDIVLLHVIDKRICAQVPEVADEILRSMEAKAKRHMVSLEKKLKDLGFRVSKKIENGVPFQQIVACAKKEDVSMIVMGSHGRSLVEEMLLGSTTENVLRHANTPLLIEKFKTTGKGDTAVCSRNHENPFKKVLYPTDFSDCAEAVVPYLKTLKDAGTHEIVVAHIQDITTVAPSLIDKLPEFEKIDTGQIERISAELKKAGIPKVKTILREGIPFVEIEAICHEEDITMIAMGSHGKSMVRELFLGSESGKIVRRSKIPTLIIHRK